MSSNRMPDTLTNLIKILGNNQPSTQLILRTLCKASQRLIQSMQTGEQSKASFVICTSLLNPPHELEKCWNYYQKILQTDKNQYAVLHKLIDNNTENILANIAREEKNFSIVSPSCHRIYRPTAHSWGYNFVWIFANIAAGKSFRIISNLTDAYKYRNTDPKKVSAFAREIYTLLQAGYTLEINQEKHMLVPPQSPEKINYTKFLASATDTKDALTHYEIIQKEDQIAAAIAEIQSEVNFYISAFKLAKNLEEITEAIDKSLLEDMVKKVMKNLVKCLINLKQSNNLEIAIKYLVKHLNFDKSSDLNDDKVMTQSKEAFGKAAKKCIAKYLVENIDVATFIKVLTLLTTTYVFNVFDDTVSQLPQYTNRPLR